MNEVDAWNKYITARIHGAKTLIERQLLIELYEENRREDEENAKSPKDGGIPEITGRG